MTNAVLVSALNLANEQLAAAQAGAFDLLMSGLASYESACAKVVAEPLSADDEATLRQLISLNARIGTYVGAAVADAATHIRRLQGGRSLAGAYLSPSAGTPDSLAADTRA